MTISLRADAIGIANSTSVASATITVPTTGPGGSVVAGDYARIVVATTATTATLATPAGWTLLSSGATSSLGGFLFGKTLTSGDIGATVTLTLTGATGRISSQMNVYSGVQATGLVVAAPVIEGANADTTATIPTISDVPAGALFDVSFAGRITSGSPPDFTPPTGYSQGTNNYHATTIVSAANVSTESLYKVVDIEAAYGGEIATTTSGTNVDFALALPPAGYVPPAAPVAHFTGTPTYGPPPLTVAFNSSATTGTVISRHWDYGDGQTGSSSSPNHTYTTEGSYTVSFTATNSGGSTTDTKTGFIVVTSTPPPAAPVDTPTLLARPHGVVPTGTYTVPYTFDDPSSDTTFDLRGARFEGYFDADAIFGFGTFSNGNGGTNATPHQLNRTPFDIGNNTKAQRAAIVGGVVIGDQPTTLTWNRMKHGSPIQNALDAGASGAEAAALIVNNQNQDGDPRIHLALDSWALIDGLRVYNTHDGFGIFSQNDDRTDTGKLYFRNTWIYQNHDDAIENDRQLGLDVDDCLFEQCYSFLSTRAGVTTGTPDTTKPQTIRNSIIWLSSKPGPYNQPTSVMAHGNLYKSQTNSPPIIVTNTIFAIEKPNSSTAGTLTYREGLDSYTDVTLVWLGTGSYPYPVPPGVTVTTDRSILDNAVNTWKSRHGVTSFDTVNMAAMLSPTPYSTLVPVPPPAPPPGPPQSNPPVFGESQVTPAEIAAAKGGEAFVFDYAHLDVAQTITLGAGYWGLYKADTVISVGSTLTATDAGTYTTSVPLHLPAFTSARVNFDAYNVTFDFTVDGGQTWSPLAEDGFIPLSANADLDLRANFADSTATVTSITVYVLATDTIRSLKGLRTMNVASDPISEGALNAPRGVKIPPSSATPAPVVGTVEFIGSLGTTGAFLDTGDSTSGGPYWDSSNPGGASGATVYVDGVVNTGVVSLNDSHHYVITFSTPTSVQLWIGTSRAGLGIGHGVTIEHLALYPQTMTAADVLNLYNNNVVGLPAIIVNDSNGITVTEYSTPVSIYAYAWQIQSGSGR